MSWKLRQFPDHEKSPCYQSCHSSVPVSKHRRFSSTLVRYQTSHKAQPLLPSLYKTQLLPPPPPWPEPNPDNKHEHSMWLSPATRPWNRLNPLASSQRIESSKAKHEERGLKFTTVTNVNLHQAACKTREPRIKLPANTWDVASWV